MTIIRTAKFVKNLIAKEMTNKKDGISVVLGECDSNMDRIEVKYPKSSSHISLNPIALILKKYNFFVAQVIDFYYDKRVVLLIRDKTGK